MCAFRVSGYAHTMTTGTDNSTPGTHDIAEPGRGAPADATGPLGRGGPAGIDAEAISAAALRLVAD